MTAPAVGVAGTVLHALAQRLFFIRVNHCIHGDRNIGNGPGEELFTDPLAAVNWISLQVL